MLVSLASLLTMGAVAQDVAPVAETSTPAVVVAATPLEESTPIDSTKAVKLLPACPVQPATESPAPVDDSARLATWEMIVFVIVVVGVIGLGIWKSSDPKETKEEKKEKGAADYFLAGRGLSWWLVGFSLIAANISTEQFVGMSGKASNWVGLAIAGYEWLAAITLVIVAFTFLPMLLKRGVFTIPQFLEERFDGKARSIMAISNLVILVGVPTAGVIYAGAKVVSGYFDLSMTTSCIIIAASATVYVYVGGLKACAWTDLIWGAALIVGGGVVLIFAMDHLTAADPQMLIQTASATSDVTVESLANSSAMERFFSLNGGEALTATNAVGGKLSMVRPASDPEIPWTALCLGLWIPNFFYWGLNQYIMQRTLASKSLAEGQKGIVFAAALKLLIPFVVIIPGILAYNLFQDDMKAQADVKNAEAMKSTTELATKSSQTPLYNITADYLMANPSGITLVEQNFTAAKPSEDNATLYKSIRLDLASTMSAEQPADITAVMESVNARYKAAKRDELVMPESVTEVAKQQRILASTLAFDLAKLNNEHIKSLTGDETSKYVASTPLVGYDYDSSFALLLRKLLPNTGWAWFVLAALFGAVVSSLASMLNSASTLFTMDIYNQIRKEQSTQSELVTVGKLGVLVCAGIALGLAIFLSTKLDSIFSYIQEFQGFLSPGALVVFLFGFFVPKCPRYFGWLGIAINVVEYALIKYVFMPDMPFLNRMAVCLVTITIVGFIVTLINSKRGGKAIVLADKGIVEMESSGSAKVAGIFVVIATIALYAAFWG